MNKEELLSLRSQILSDVVPLVLQSTGQGFERFSMLLRIIQAGGASGDVYRSAYESAKSIEDNDERLSALLSLLDEVDLDTISPADGSQQHLDAPIDSRPQESLNIDQTQ